LRSGIAVGERLVADVLTIRAHCCGVCCSIGASGRRAELE
jgi:hypothetical protein